MPEPMRDVPTPDSGKKTGRRNELVRAESMVQLALALPASCLIGWVVGAWLDGHFHQHWMMIACIVLGAIAGFVQIVTTASRFLKNGR